LEKAVLREERSLSVMAFEAARMSEVRRTLERVDRTCEMEINTRKKVKEKISIVEFGKSNLWSKEVIVNDGFRSGTHE
jgi:arginine/lysine/ornithine decarboxylase